MTIHHPHAILQMARQTHRPASPKELDYRLHAERPCPSGQPGRYRAEVTLQGNRYKQHLQRAYLQRVVSAIGLCPTSLRLCDPGFGHTLALEADEHGVILAKLWLT